MFNNSSAYLPYSPSRSLHVIEPHSASLSISGFRGYPQTNLYVIKCLDSASCEIKYFRIEVEFRSKTLNVQHIYS